MLVYRGVDRRRQIPAASLIAGLVCVLLPACQTTHPLQTDPRATDESRFAAEIESLTRDMARQSAESTSQIEKLQQQLSQIEHDQVSAQASLQSLERTLAELNARLHERKYPPSDPVLQQEIARLIELQVQMTSRLDGLHEDLLKVQMELVRLEKAPDCCDRIRDFETRIHDLETKSNQPDPSKWIGDLISFVGIVVGVVLGTRITPLITRRADRRKYTLQTWESFLKMYPEIAAAQVSLSKPEELTSDSFAKVQAVRTWMSAFTLFSKSDVLDQDLVRELKLEPAMGHFVDSLEAAVAEAKKAGADPRATLWAKDLETELMLSDDIKKFSQSRSAS
jgi:hypothetical protein